MKNTKKKCEDYKPCNIKDKDGYRMNNDRSCIWREGAVMPRFFDVKDREITDGCVIWNQADKNSEQLVQLIDGELWFGAKGTTPNEGNDWCKLDKR